MVLIRSCSRSTVLEQHCTLCTIQHASSISKDDKRDMAHIIGLYLFNDIDISFKIVLIYAEM